MVRHNVLKGLYEVDKTIGCGGFAKVKLATHLATGEKVAIKIMNKTLLGDDLHRVQLELEALKSFSHEHICKLYQVIETDNHFFIVMEYCSGGELFDHIVEKNRLSESESRMFFRQIVSAVAYLHSKGYAHRDLKPENVLLDKQHNLKLIDFGLCAKPSGGVWQSPLYTSCGSPTYAAPELVLGKQYLGPEVDVWAMGVLLYALLAGSLPFDDQNIDNLYKKILSGKYIEPIFMSKESRRLIKSMLQVDPKKRVTVTELLSHPWMTLGILNPVTFKGDENDTYDEDCLRVMANYYQVEQEVMLTYLRKCKYDYHTATYNLLLSRKKRRLSLRMCNGRTRYSGSQEIMQSSTKPSTKLSKTPETNDVSSTPNNVAKSNQLIVVITDADAVTPKKNDAEKSPCTPNNQDICSPFSEFTEPKRPRQIRRPQKRLRSPVPDDENSPVPTKRATPGKTPVKTPGKTTPRTPDRKKTKEIAHTPGSARRVLGSIERSLHRMRHVLTPRKPTDLVPAQPALLTSKELCNVSTTHCKDPEFVISELSKALEKKGIQCTRKGYRLKGNFEPSAIQRYRGCYFELEICYIPNLYPPKAAKDIVTPTKPNPKKGVAKTPVKYTQEEILKTPVKPNSLEVDGSHSDGAIEDTAPFVGIRRKRLKGDSWCYKKVCEEVLALTATGFKQVLESAV